MKSLSHYIANPVLSSNSESLEKEEMKENRRINTLFKLNVKKIMKSNKEGKRINLFCIQGRMYIQE